MTDTDGAQTVAKGKSKQTRMGRWMTDGNGGRQERDPLRKLSNKQVLKLVFLGGPRFEFCEGGDADRGGGRVCFSIYLQYATATLHSRASLICIYIYIYTYIYI